MRRVVYIIGIIIVVVVIYWIVRRRYVEPSVNTLAVPTRVKEPPKEDPCVEGVIYKRGDDVCIWGHPNPIPRSDIEISRTSYNDGFMRIDRHPFLLFRNGSLRIHRHWWRFNNVQYLVQGYDQTKGYYFVQVSDGLYYVSNTDMRLLTNSVYDKMVFYESTPYVLRDGRLYRCPSTMEFVTANFKLRMDHWDVEPINFIGGFDVRFMEIVDVSVADNDELILIIDSGRVLYIPSSKESDLINGRYLKDVVDRKVKYHNPFKGIKLELLSDTRSIVTTSHATSWRNLPIHRILLGSTSDVFLVFYNHDVALIKHDRITLRLSGITQATLGPIHLYTVDLSGTLREYVHHHEDKSLQHQCRILSHNVSNVFITRDHLALISNSNIVSKLS